MYSDVRSLPLGQLLLQVGLLTREQLDHALAVHATEGGRLGQVLVQLGYISDRDLSSSLADQFGVVFDSNPEENFEPELARTAGEAMISRHAAIPIRLDGDRLVLGMVYPGDLTAVDDFAAITGKRVTPVVVTERALERMQMLAFRLHGTPDGAAATVPEVRLVGERETARVVALVSDILEQGLGLGVSDIHLEPLPDVLRVRYRLDGVLIEAMRLPGTWSAGVVTRIKVMANLDISERRQPQDGRLETLYKGHVYDLRVATLPAIYGEKATIRVLDRSREGIDLAELGLPEGEQEKLFALSRRPHGMLLLSGPTGSGKTTTLAALLADLNSTERHIVTIEDPVEYRLVGVTQVQVNPKAGVTFASGLRSFLRSDPDVIMVGEIRDGETAQLAVRAALTGHMLLSTIHTTSAASSVVRLVEMGIEPYLVASCLTGVVAQRLVRKLCPRCKQPAEGVGPADQAFAPLLDGATPCRPVGCNYCNNTGYRGRTGLYELLPVSPAIAELIARPGVTSADVERLARAEGMTTLRESGAARVAAGETSVEELRRVLLVEV